MILDAREKEEIMSENQISANMGCDSPSGLHPLQQALRRDSDIPDAYRRVLDVLPASLAMEEVIAHFELMPSAYWKSHSVDDIIWHLQTIHHFFERLVDPRYHGACPLMAHRHEPDEGYTEVVVCTWDRTGLFSQFAGSVASVNLNICDASIYTRSDDVALDIFKLCDSGQMVPARTSALRQLSVVFTEWLETGQEPPIAPEIYQGKKALSVIDPGKSPFRPEIKWGSDELGRIQLDIQAQDRCGLLYRISSEITRCGLEIASARVQTDKGIIHDTFLLTGRKGAVVSDSEMLKNIEKALMTFL